MDVTEIRRLNMRALATSAGGITAFADKLDRSQSQISHLIGKNPIKNIGNKLAREVERLYKLSHGWLDQSHPELWRQHDLTTNEDALPPVASVRYPTLELTPKQVIVLDHFEALTEEQQGELIRELEEKKQRNEAIFEALSRKRQAGKEAKV